MKQIPKGWRKHSFAAGIITASWTASGKIIYLNLYVPEFYYCSWSGWNRSTDLATLDLQVYSQLELRTRSSGGMRTVHFAKAAIRSALLIYVACLDPVGIWVGGRWLSVSPNNTFNHWDDQWEHPFPPLYLANSPWRRLMLWRRKRKGKASGS